MLNIFEPCKIYENVHSFHGPMRQINSELAFELMMENVRNAESSTAAYESLIESAMAGRNDGILNEAILENLKKGVLAFYEKILAMIHGIIDRLKAYGAKRSTKTEEWSKIMGPKVDDVIKSGKMRSMLNVKEGDMHNWDSEFILTGMYSSCQVLINKWKTNGSKFDVFKGGLGTDKKDYMQDFETFKNKDFINELTTTLRIKHSETLEDVWKNVNAKATGDTAFVKTFNYTKMMETVRNSTATISNMTKLYESLANELNTHKQRIASMVSANYTKDNGDNVSKDGSGMSVDDIYQMDKNFTTLYINAIDKLRGINISAFEAMMREYMGILTKLVDQSPKAKTAPVAKNSESATEKVKSKVEDAKSKITKKK